MRILVTSASGANGNGYGAVLGFGPEGDFTGPFSSDPRVAGVICLRGGPSAHLAIVSRGLQLGCVMGVELEAELSPGDQVRVDEDGKVWLA